MIFCKDIWSELEVKNTILKVQSPSDWAEVASSLLFFSGSSCLLVSSWGIVLVFPLLLGSGISLPCFRAAALSLARLLQGVLLELITADTRRGTETAKGSEMLTALRWCRGEDSRGKKLPGKEGRVEVLWDEYSILLFFGDVGWKPFRSSPLNTFSCSGSVFCGGNDVPNELLWFTCDVQPAVAPLGLIPLISQVGSSSLRSKSESEPSVRDLTSGAKMLPAPAAGLFPVLSSSKQ